MSNKSKNDLINIIKPFFDISLFFIIFTCLGYSQTDGITYQAIIIDPDVQ